MKTKIRTLRALNELRPRKREKKIQTQKQKPEETKQSEPKSKEIEKQQQQRKWTKFWNWDAPIIILRVVLVGVDTVELGKSINEHAHKERSNEGC